MKNKKNGVTINLTEADIKLLKEQLQTPSLGTTGSDFQKDLMDIKHQGEKDILKAKYGSERQALTGEMKKLGQAALRFHPELKNLEKGDLRGALEYIFRDGKFNKRNMMDVCKEAPTFCEVFPHPEVMEVLVKVT